MEQYTVKDPKYRMEKMHQVRELLQYQLEKIGPAGAILIHRLPKKRVNAATIKIAITMKVPHPCPRVN